MPYPSRTQRACPVRHAELQSRGEQNELLYISSFHPIFVSTSALLPPFLFPFHKTKRNEYSQGYIHCIPYGKVSLVTKLSPLHPGYVSTVCASPRPSSNNPTAITENNCENMVIYTLLFCSLTIFQPDARSEWGMRNKVIKVEAVERMKGR
jgi:hypothetical protein